MGPMNPVLSRGGQPDPDGLSVLVDHGNGDQTVKLLQGNRGKMLELPHAAVMTWAFSPNGRKIVTASSDGTAKVWNTAMPKFWPIANAKELATLKGHSGAITAVAFSPDGKRIVTGGGSGDHTIRLWDASTGKESLMLEGHESQITDVLFSSDGHWFVTHSWDGTLNNRDQAKDWNAWRAASPEQVSQWQKEEKAAMHR